MGIERYQIGQVYNLLKVIDLYYKSNKYGKKELYATTECINCHKIKHMRARQLYCSRNNSCQCQVEICNGLHKHPLYSIWGNMKDRCYNPKCRAYSHYGQRGIQVCDEWKDNFLIFYNWAIAHGWEKGLSIDRINNDGNYEPSNCQFLTVGENTGKANRHNVRRKNNSGKQYYISKDGMEYIFDNANAFCREHQELDLDANTLRETARGVHKHKYKGWYCDYYTQGENVNE